MCTYVYIRTVTSPHTNNGEMTILSPSSFWLVGWFHFNGVTPQFREVVTKKNTLDATSSLVVLGVNHS